MRSGSLLTALLSAATLFAAPALAEVKEVRIAQQFGLTYLPLIIAQSEKLIEKEAEKAGIGPLKVEWARLSGGAAANDALISGSVDYVSAGMSPLLVLWDKTRGNANVKAVAALDASALFLNTTNPKVQSIADFTDADRIALPAVKVSHQAVLLQMAAEKLWGAGQQTRLDKLTVALPHPEATAALLAGRTEITAHFANSPFQYIQLRDPKIRRVLSSEDVLGGPSTVTSVYTSSKFRDANPKVNAALLAALRQAQDLIARDKPRAAAIFVAAEKSALSEVEVLGILNDPATRYSLSPINSHKFADFMFRTGLLKAKPESWRDYYFSDIHDQPGS